MGRPGGQQKYSAAAIETALTLRLISHLPLRQAEGFLSSVFAMMGLHVSTPDHTTLCRRGQSLNIRLRRLSTSEPIHLFIDSTGLTMMGQGEWAAAKHGTHGKRRWKKLHVAVNDVGVIVAQALTEDNVQDATTGVELVQAAPGDVVRVTADAAYDTRAFYDTAGTRGATVVVPPKKTACVTGRGPRSEARDRTIEALNRAGRRQWKKEAGYHRQARVENTFFRYKTIIGGSLRVPCRGGQETETVIAYNVLNEMTARGRPDSYAISR